LKKEKFETLLAELRYFRNKIDVEGENPEYLAGMERIREELDIPPNAMWFFDRESGLEFEMYNTLKNYLKTNELMEHLSGF
jgi:hypothetical protein